MVKNSVSQGTLRVLLRNITQVVFLTYFFCVHHIVEGIHIHEHLEDDFLTIAIIQIHFGIEELGIIGLFVQIVYGLINKIDENICCLRSEISPWNTGLMDKTIFHFLNKVCAELRHDYVLVVLSLISPPA